MSKLWGHECYTRLRVESRTGVHR